MVTPSLLLFLFSGIFAVMLWVVLDLLDSGSVVLEKVKMNGMEKDRMLLPEHFFLALRQLR